MRRIVAALSLGLLACPPPAIECTGDNDPACGANGHCVENICVANGGGGGGAGGGGGVAGGIGGGGGGGGGTNVCTGVTTCPATTECRPDAGAAWCEVRFSGLAFETPAGELYGVGAVPVRARLNLKSGFAATGFPPTLRCDAGFAGATLGHDGGGVYIGAVPVSSAVASGNWALTASVFPDGGLPASTTFSTDTLAPVVTLAAVAAPARLTTVPLIERDPAVGYAAAYRKDEVVEVRVEASESVTVGPGDFTGGAALTARGSCTTCPASFCRCFDLDLATVPLPAFRGDVTVGLGSVRDAVGNQSAGTPDLVLKVTRWKWVRQLAGNSKPIRAPTVSVAGVVYVGVETSVNDTGLITALLPGGELLPGFGWDGGAVTAATLLSGTNLYVASKNATDGRLIKLDAATGAQVGSACSDATWVFDSSLALLNPGQSPEAVAAVESGGNGLMALRVGGIPVCPPQAGVPGLTGTRYSVVASDGYVFAAENNAGAIYRSPWTTAAGFTWQAVASNTTPLFTQGLVVFGTIIGGGGGPTVGGVYALATDAGFTTGRGDYPAGSSPPAGPAVVAGTMAQPVFVFGNNAPVLARAAMVAAATPSFTDAGVVPLTAATSGASSAPVVGANGDTYFVDSKGGVYAFDLAWQQKWYLPPGTTGINGAPSKVDSNAALDVNRVAGAKVCGRGGVLYIPSTGDGSLYAFIVDADGLDRNAPWPKWQHDNGNTGNPATSLVPWSCP